MRVNAENLLEPNCGVFQGYFEKNGVSVWCFDGKNVVRWW
jgi:hypothetical protein